jgi:hypothetical protein
MAKAKTPSTGNTTTTSKKQVITMPEAGSPVLVKKTSAAGKSSNPELDAAIRQRAYELYQERGCTPGNENDDWLRAEREVKARHNAQQTA